MSEEFPPELESRSLMEHLVLCEEILASVEQESAALKGRTEIASETHIEAKRALLERLKGSLEQLRHFRKQWQSLSQDEQGKHPEALKLIRQNQDIIMRIIVLDRENEQHLLKQGLVPPRHIPSAAQRRPNYVASLYKRGG